MQPWGGTITNPFCRKGGRRKISQNPRGETKIAENKETGKENTALETSVELMQEEIMKLQQEKDSLTDALIDEKTANSSLNSHIEAQVRGRLKDDLKTMGCTYGAEELGKMDLDELKTLKRHYTFFNPPVFKSSADKALPRKNIYDDLYSKYIPLDERIKQMRES